MKIINIGTDRNLFDEKSEVHRRMIEYGKLVEELYIIVFSLQSSAFSQKFSNVFVYPTNSRSRWFYVWDAIKIGRKIIRNLKLEIRNSRDNLLITSQDPFECGLVGWWLKRKFGIPLQLQIHTDFLSPYFWRESLLNKIRVWIAKFLIPRTNCLRVVSERIKNSLLRVTRYPLRVTILPIFIDVEKIKNTPIKTNLHQKYPQFDFIILMASRLTKEKNISLAIEAVKEINNINVGLIIVGDGPEKENYELYKNIIIESWTDDLILYYKTADLFLLTSNYEGYGMTLVEAAASGCKIISSDVGIAGEILNKENIFRVGDKKDLKEKIEKAINGKIKACPPLKINSKEEYLKKYKQSWETCAS